MTMILKSNSAYAGASSLSNVAVLTKTAANLYADYAARVTADGGTVSNPAECLAVITAALAGDYFYRTAAAVSARWGRKVSGPNVTKLYNLRGTIDAVMTGSVALDTTTVPGEELCEFQAGDVMTLTGLTVLAAGATGLAVLNAGSYVGSQGQTAFTPAAQAWQVNQGTGAFEFYVNAVLKMTSSPDYTGATLDAHGFMAEMVTQRMTSFLNGAQRKVTTPGGGFTAIAAGATATVTYLVAAGTPRLGEQWLFNDMSGMPGVLAMMRASQDLDGRY